MIENPMTNFLVERTVYEFLHEMCQEDIKRAMKVQIGKLVKEELESGKDENKKKHDEFFGVLFKAISPYKREFEDMLRAIWDEEERIIIANLKKMKKAWMTKDVIDQILYPVSVFEKKLANGTTQIFIKLMDKEGQRVVAIYGLDIVFDVENPEVQKWLAKYVPKFSKKLEAVNVEKLRAELTEGMKAGESIKELMKRVYTTYDDWGFRRAELIARTETLRASNEAALETYRQSGVVEKKIWITYIDDKTCEECDGLDGAVEDLEEDFSGGVDGPPLHPRCRCAVGPFVED